MPEGVSIGLYNTVQEGSDQWDDFVRDRGHGGGGKFHYRAIIYFGTIKDNAILHRMSQRSHTG